jgi:hypothetical protein
MARPKKQKVDISNISQTNGALPVSKPQSVYEIIGMKISNYKQTNISDYKEFLNKMNLSELQNHAITVANLIPIDDRRRLMDRLEKEFLRVTTQFAPPTANQVIIPQENQDNIRKIMSQRF